MLYSRSGARKYVTLAERQRFIEEAKRADPKIETFCIALAYTGARISEVLNLNHQAFDYSAKCIVIESLKKRRAGVFRTVPVPDELLDRIEEVHQIRSQVEGEVASTRLWNWCRTTAWKHVKVVMMEANIIGPHAVPKALRHGFGVLGTVEAGVPLNIMQKWLGHARIETTARYADAVGREERILARRLWTR